MNFDQQVPREDELVEPERSNVTRELFSREPAGPDDRFMAEYARRQQASPSAEVETRVRARRVSSGQRRGERAVDSRFEGVPADEPGSIWLRIYRVFARHFDFNWRP